MPNFFVKTAVRTRFSLTSRNKASLQIRKFGNIYLSLSRKINSEFGTRPVVVPQMPEVDEDMRNWSFFMLLEHNTIVNRSITSVVQSLARGEEPVGPGAIDPKAGVMPSPNPGEEQIEAFRESVDAHLEVVSDLPRLRGTIKKRHPVFGDFDAHRWHCMFGLHLMIHYKQAKMVVQKAVS
jgi:hypothetical protein